jgi:hypothetical protein
MKIRLEIYENNDWRQNVKITEATPLLTTNPIS